MNYSKFIRCMIGGFISFHINFFGILLLLKILNKKSWSNLTLLFI